MVWAQRVVRLSGRMNGSQIREKAWRQGFGKGRKRITGQPTTGYPAITISSTSTHPSIQQLDDLPRGISGQNSEFLGKNSVLRLLTHPQRIDSRITAGRALMVSSVFSI
jgi:hypothetical protein